MSDPNVTAPNYQSDIDQQWAGQEKQLRAGKYAKGLSGAMDIRGNGGMGGGLINIGGDIGKANAENQIQNDKQKFYTDHFQQAQGNLVNQERGLAQDFRNQMPGYENQMYGDINAQARSDLATQQQGIRRSASQRGLLYSGLRAGSENSAGADVASRAASAKSQIAPGLEKQANALDAQAVQAQQAKQISDLQIANNVFDTALQNYKDNMSAVSGLYQAGGKIAGSYFANKGKT